MKQRISIRGKIDGETTRFHKIKMDKIEEICPSCKKGVIPEKPFGTIFIPKVLGIPQEILINLVHGCPGPGSREHSEEIKKGG